MTYAYIDYTSVPEDNKVFEVQILKLNVDSFLFQVYNIFFILMLVPLLLYVCDAWHYEQKDSVKSIYLKLDTTEAC